MRALNRVESCEVDFEVIFTVLHRVARVVGAAQGGVGEVNRQPSSKSADPGAAGQHGDIHTTGGRAGASQRRSERRGGANSSQLKCKPRGYGKFSAR